MGNTVIEVNSLSKAYRLGVINHGMLYKDMQSWLARKRGKEDPHAKIDVFKREQADGDDRFWALNDISFDIKQGDRLGIIGKNGAGKSTLLKILSRVTTPTSGDVKIKGHIASLLEVGTGFHPELTGRENIYLNGAILGMSRAEIKKKFDEIVDFSEVEKFLDTPVKRYSSGMYVRLAFAVAAHLEPEILIVDEVLAVGDLSFQKKCLGKMGDVSKKEGRTVLYVSHNLSSVEQLCNRVILLESGKIKAASDDVNSVINLYSKIDYDGEYDFEWHNHGMELFKNDYFHPKHIFLTNNSGEKINSATRNDSSIQINITGIINLIDDALIIGYGLYNENGIFLYGSTQTDMSQDEWPVLRYGKVTLKTIIPNNFLNEGKYKIELYFGLLNKEWFSHIEMEQKPQLCFEIKGGLSKSPYWIQKKIGFFAPVFKWEVE